MLRAGLLVLLAAAAVPAARAQDGPRNYVVVGDAIPEPLTSRPGDAARGRAIVANRSVGLCLNPDTIMPPYYRTTGLQRVAKAFDGKTILTAEQVEDVVAYLATLKE